jgi:hypothetical protein
VLYQLSYLGTLVKSIPSIALYNIKTSSFSNQLQQLIAFNEISEISKTLCQSCHHLRGEQFGSEGAAYARHVLGPVEYSKFLPRVLVGKRTQRTGVEECPANQEKADGRPFDFSQVMLFQLPHSFGTLLSISKGICMRCL